MAHEFDDLIRAIPEDQVGRFDAQLGREFLLQIKRVAVRIQIHARERLLHGRHRQGRRTEGILFGRHFDDGVRGQAKFAGDFFDGGRAELNTGQRFEEGIQLHPINLESNAV